MIPLFALGLAHAGYGDVIDGGYPAWMDRDMHLWINAVRVDPSAFEAEYINGECSFDDFAEEEQQAQSPLMFDYGLNEAARYHCQDMYDNDWFDHDSSDGTTFEERLARYYDSGWLGENIAWGYPDAYTTLMTGWMCSDGHRENIMNVNYTELGAANVSDYYTADFGAGAVETSSPIGMGVHEPEYAAGTASFYADWDSAEPDSILVWVNGLPHGLKLLYGTEIQGVYGNEVELGPGLDGGDCHIYHFSWSQGGDSGTFPEDGSYTIGEDCDDGGLGWVETQLDGSAPDLESVGDGERDGWLDDRADPLLTTDIKVVGCSSARGAAWLGWLLAPLAVRRRRR